VNVSTELNLTMRSTATKAGDLTTTAPNAIVTAQYIQKMITGTGANQADVVYADSATMIADAFATYDLSGVVQDIFGDNVVMARVKGVYLKNTSTLASTIKLGGGSDGAGTNAWDTWITSTAADGSEGILVRPGAFVFLWAPDATAWATVAGTADLLCIEEQSTLAASFDLVVVGAST
jgi:hypothetical protein